MYNGNENLINDGKYLPYSMLNYWQWAYSNLLQNLQRGTFAEFIVRCSLIENGIDVPSERYTSIQPYDIEGPTIPALGRKSRLEVKSAAFVQLWDIRHPDRANYLIAPAKMPDEKGDYNENAPRQRNNDIYVFTLYTATDRRSNILDLSWWQFFVLPTFKIEEDAKLSKQKTISLKTVKQLCEAQSFDTLCQSIVEACNQIKR